MRLFVSCLRKTSRLPKFVRFYTTMSGLQLNEVVAKLNTFAPLALAEAWDNVGLLIEPSAPKHVKKILLTNDLTETVMNESLEARADMILSYHPPIFAPLKRLTPSSWKERLVLKCIENSIALYSPHTAWDAVHGGVNDWMAKAFGDNVESINPLTRSYSSTPAKGCTHMVELPLVFGYQGKQTVRDVLELLKDIPAARIEEHISTADGYENLTILCPESALVSIVELFNASPFSHGSRSVRIIRLDKIPIPNTGMGRLVQLQQKQPLGEIIDLIKKHLGIPHVRLALAQTSNSDDVVEIQTIGLCAGSGSSVLKGVRADLYLTGEMSHHDVLDANHNGTHVILCEHTNTERGFLKAFAADVAQVLGNQVELVASVKDKDPLQVV